MNYTSTLPFGLDCSNLVRDDIVRRGVEDLI